MARYIDADKFLQGIVDEYGHGSTEILVMGVLKQQPTAEVVEVKHSEWILHSDGSGTCKICGKHQKHIWDMDNWQNFCGHCGAKMNGGKAE